VELEDRITIATPEGIELQIVLAGAASRFIACVIDLFVQVVLIVLAALAALGLLGGGWGTALFAMTTFAALYLYHVLFELLASGRTPGKRVTHLRVVRERGTPVDLPASAIRNLLRLIDILPTAYLVGLASILITKRNQRLGDLAAGTLVIRDVSRRKQLSPAAAAETTQAHDGRNSSSWDVSASGWDVSAVSIDELVAVRRFLERRESLDRGARQQLAHRLEHGLRTKVAGAPSGMSAEGFLEELARVKASR
jgi:uncharacterized RDD family membrane protein YckC